MTVKNHTNSNLTPLDPIALKEHVYTPHRAQRRGNLRLTERGKVAAFVSVAALTAVLGTLAPKAAQAAEDVFKSANNPACEVGVHPGDTVDGILGKLQAEGQDYEDLAPNGQARTMRNFGYITPDGSPVLPSGDQLVVSDVDPKICVAVGGAVISQAQKP